VFAESIESNLREARHLADAIDASDDFERLVPVPLSIVWFRYVRRGLREAVADGDHPALEQVNQLNRRRTLELQREGEA
jgi:glutamate/tyrosine decarboxylase-like PLP-dependent enzyme